MKFGDLQTSKKPKKEEKKITLKDIEPGNKIPVANYKQFAQWCNICEDVEAHVYSKEFNKTRCLKCKTTKQLKEWEPKKKNKDKQSLTKLLV